MKVRLTPEGEELAGRLYARAVELGDIDGLPGVDTRAILAQETDRAATAATIEQQQPPRKAVRKPAKPRAVKATAQAERSPVACTALHASGAAARVDVAASRQGAPDHGMSRCVLRSAFVVFLLIVGAFVYTSMSQAEGLRVVSTA